MQPPGGSAAERSGRLDQLQQLHPEPRAPAWIDRLAPARAIVTNLHVDMDYRTLLRTLPPGVEPAWDGLALPFDP